MAPSSSPWLTDADLEEILTSPIVLISARLPNDVTETVMMPKYLLEKYSTIFSDEFEAYAEDHPDGSCPTLIVHFSMHYDADEAEIMVREWDMCTVLFKWMLSGRIVECGRGKVVGTESLSWGSYCDERFVWAVAEAVTEGL